MTSGRRLFEVPGIKDGLTIVFASCQVIPLNGADPYSALVLSHSHSEPFGIKFDAEDTISAYKILLPQQSEFQALVTKDASKVFIGTEIDTADGHYAVSFSLCDLMGATGSLRLGLYCHAIRLVSGTSHNIDGGACSDTTLRNSILLQAATDVRKASNSKGLHPCALVLFL